MLQTTVHWLPGETVTSFLETSPREHISLEHFSLSHIATGRSKTAALGVFMF